MEKNCIKFLLIYKKKKYIYISEILKINKTIIVEKEYYMEYTLYIR